MSSRVALLVVALVTLPFVALAHPDGRGLTRGEVLAVTAKSFDFRSDHDTLTLLITDDTIFELKKKRVDRSQLRKGDWVDVAIAGTVTGDLMAGKVVLGMPRPPAASKPVRK